METGRVIYRFGDCELDEGRQELRRGGVPCHLEPQVFAVLAYLVRHRDRMVTRAELLDEIWGSRFVTDSALASRVKAARRAVGDSGRDQRVIRTHHGRGYRFLAPVTEQSPAGGGAPVAAPPLPAPQTAATPAGRAAELAQLGDWYDRAAQGRRQVVFVTGEAGIGKTTLVEAFAAAVADGRAGRVARGQCLEQRGRPSPTCRSSTPSSACATTTPRPSGCCPRSPHLARPAAVAGRRRRPGGPGAPRPRRHPGPDAAGGGPGPGGDRPRPAAAAS